MEKFTKWLIYSSTNPNEFSLTLKGAVATLLPVVLLLIKQLGFSLNGVDVEQFILSYVTVLTTAITLFGLMRKLYFTFKEKEVVVFVKKAPAKKVAKKKAIK